MPCYNTKKIRNRKADYIAGIDSVQMSVPCGTCLGCQKDIKDEWYVRCFYQWQFYNNLGGCTMFVTLTYNNDHLPHIEVDGESVECFSYKDIKTFLNTLRQTLKRQFGIGEKNKLGMTYFICSELGELKQRPHYHGLLHFPPAKYNYKQLMDIVKHAWDKRGFVKYSNSGAFVDKSNAIQYCSKYAGKQLAFYDNTLMRKYLAHLKDLAKEGMESESRQIRTIAKDKYVNILGDFEDEVRFKTYVRYIYKHGQKMDKGFMPRHYQSQGYGRSLYDMYKDKTHEEKTRLLMQGIRINPDDNFCHQVPRYIKNKLLYTTTKVEDKQGFTHDVRKLNDFGIDFTRTTFKDRVNTLAANMERNCSFLGLTSMCISAQDAERLINLHLKTNLKFADFVDIKDTLDILREDMSWQDIAKYKLLKRGRTCGFDVDTIFNVQLNQHKIPIDVWTPSLLEDKEYYDSQLKEVNTNRSSIDMLLDIIDVLSADFNARKSLAKELKDKQVSHFKHKFYGLLYT